MRIVITGASSFLGQTLIRLFIKRGDEVIAIGRKLDSVLPPDVLYLTLEMSQYKTLNIENGADVFINLAWAGTSHDGRNNKKIQEENIEYSLDAIRAAKNLGCKVFIESGSQAEYGISNKKTNEKSDCSPITEYGKAKLHLQQQAFELSAELGITYIHLRIFSLIGERDHNWTLVMSTIEAMLQNVPVNLTKCLQLWNFLYVEDAAKMIIEICQHYLHKTNYYQKIYNIASNDTRQLKDFVEKIKFLTNSSSICNYGAVDSSNIVSLNPDIDAYISEIGGMEFTPFDQIIENIIKYKDYDKGI